VRAIPIYRDEIKVMTRNLVCVCEEIRSTDEWGEERRYGAINCLLRRFLGRRIYDRSKNRSLLAVSYIKNGKTASFFNHRLL
jgi:hypothetical protein